MTTSITCDWPMSFGIYDSCNSNLNHIKIVIITIATIRLNGYIKFSINITNNLTAKSLIDFYLLNIVIF